VAARNAGEGTGKMEVPEYLYKYRPINKYTVQSIARNQVYYALAGELNDPLDCLIVPMIVDTEQDARVWKESIANENYERFHEQFEHQGYQRMLRTTYDEGVRKLTERTAALSLTVHGKSVIMFDRYAENHRGVCLKYECRDNDLLRKAVRVDYVSEVPKVMLLGRDATSHEDKVRIHYFTEGRDWVHKQEWRLVRQDVNIFEPKGIIADLPLG
jgi:hypothetical protein